MSKKKIKKRQSVLKKPGVQPVSSGEGLKISGETNGRPDYGGIPDMDLKKNLGCG